MCKFITSYLKNDPQAGLYMSLGFTIITALVIYNMIKYHHILVGIIAIILLGVIYTFYYIWRLDYWETLKLSGSMIKSVIRKGEKK
jgi:hypothetical protein